MEEVRTTCRSLACEALLHTTLLAIFLAAAIAMIIAYTTPGGGTWLHATGAGICGLIAFGISDTAISLWTDAWRMRSDERARQLQEEKNI
jgi:hypothetical protein